MTSLTIRRWHGYIGMFIAPTVLFFSLTGAMQLFNLHEAHGNYQPPALLEKLGKLHKDQVFEQQPSAPEAPHVEAPAPGGADADAHQHHHEQKAPRVTVYVLKWFCLFVALGLATSTAFGIWMGLKSSLQRRTNVVLLVAGTVLPIVLILI